MQWAPRFVFFPRRLVFKSDVLRPPVLLLSETENETGTASRDESV